MFTLKSCTPGVTGAKVFATIETLVEAESVAVAKIATMPHLSQVFVCGTDKSVYFDIDGSRIYRQPYGCKRMALTKGES